MPVFDFLCHFFDRSFLNETVSSLGTTTILLSHQLQGFVVHLFLSDIFFGVVLSDNIVRVVVRSVGLLIVVNHTVSNHNQCVFG
jgi:hypothetical protein